VKEAHAGADRIRWTSDGHCTEPDVRSAVSEPSARRTICQSGAPHGERPELFIGRSSKRARPRSRSVEA
jgi:hypothetical protein